jgi:hypothetical protein
MPENRKTEEPTIQVEHREGCDVLHIMQGGKEVQVPGFPVTQPKLPLPQEIGKPGRRGRTR